MYLLPDMILEATSEGPKYRIFARPMPNALHQGPEYVSHYTGQGAYISGNGAGIGQSNGSSLLPSPEGGSIILGLPEGSGRETSFRSRTPQVTIRSSEHSTLVPRRCLGSPRMSGSGDTSVCQRVASLPPAGTRGTIATTGAIRSCPGDRTAMASLVGTALPMPNHAGF